MKTIKTQIQCWVLLLWLPAACVYGQGTAFTYQGQLQSGGVAAAGSFDFTFALFSANSGGAPLAGTLTNLGVGLSSGSFTVTLDFGQAYPAAEYLEIGVRPSGGSAFTTLAPRQPLTPTPYAIYAEGATSANSVAAQNITGTLASSALPSNAVFSGTITASDFAGNGAALTNVSESALNSQGSLTLTSDPLFYANGPAVYVGPYANGVTPITNLFGSGHIDMLGSSYYSTIVVMTNDGHGNLVSNATLVSPGEPYRMAAIDANNDGKPDFVAINSVSNTVTVFTNSGTSLVSNATYIVGSLPYDVVVLDVNNDGYPDIVTVNNGSGNVTILTNNQHGGFVSNTSIPVGLDPSTVSIAHLFNNGRSDLVVANSGTNTVTLLVNQGNGVFLPSTVVACAPPGEAYEAVAGDFRGTGYSDLAVLASGGINILSNNGNGTFTIAATNNSAVYPEVIKIADVNLDGRPDIVAAAYGNFLAVLLNTGNDTFSSNIIINTSQGGYFYSLAVADLNGDGRPDFVGGQGFGDYIVEMLSSNGPPSTMLSAAGFNGGLAVMPASDGGINVVAGASGNNISLGVTGSVIAGGGSSIGPGPASVNQIASSFSSVGGGAGNSIGIGSAYSVIAGGQNNLISNSADHAFIGSGQGNLLAGQSSSIVGGVKNQISAYVLDAFIGGGSQNAINDGGESGIVTGSGNSISTAEGSFIGGGLSNTIGDYSTNSFVGGGLYNQIYQNSPVSTIAGGGVNYIYGTYSTVGGGYGNNIIGSAYSVIAGGQLNIIEDSPSNPDTGVIGGGQQNSIAPNSDHSTIGGGQQNSIAAHADHSTIGGGWVVAIGQNDYEATIAGGYYCTISNKSAYSTIAGGGHNVIYGDSGDSGSSFIGGGYNETINTNSQNSVIVGGYSDSVGANSYDAAIGGGSYNQANAPYSTVPGGQNNFAGGTGSFAAGQSASANNPGSFVWGDGTRTVNSPGNNTFSILASGGVWFYDSTTANVGVKLTPGATAWTSISDRNQKKNFVPVNAEAILGQLMEVPISRWNYKWEKDTDTPNIGPMAQDFKAAFYPGRDDKGITTLEFDGVELAAIQGLNTKLQSEVKRLDAENAELKARLDRLEKLMSNKDLGAK